MSDPVLVAQQRSDPGIEYLPGCLLWLLQNFCTVFGVSEVAEVRPFVKKALAEIVDLDRKIFARRSCRFHQDRDVARDRL